MTSREKTMKINGKDVIMILTLDLRTGYFDIRPKVDTEIQPNEAKPQATKKVRKRHVQRHKT